MEFDELKGLSKTDILEQFGDCYNDFFSDIWMYRVNEKRGHINFMGIKQKVFPF